TVRTLRVAQWRGKPPQREGPPAGFPLPAGPRALGFGRARTLPGAPALVPPTRPGNRPGECPLIGDAAVSAALLTPRPPAGDPGGEPVSAPLVAGPRRPREVVGVFFQRLAPPLLHDVDELLVDVVEHRLGVALLLLLRRRERIEERLVLAGCEHAALHAEL